MRIDGAWEPWHIFKKAEDGSEINVERLPRAVALDGQITESRIE